MSRSADDVELEARRFVAYLIGQEPPRDLIDRYRRANQLLLSDPLAPEDRALMEIVRTRPSLLPLLDGACGLIRPESILRRKLLLMLALLETAPEFADLFDPAEQGGPRAFAVLIGQGGVGVLQAAGGLLLWPLVALRARLSRVR